MPSELAEKNIISERSKAAFSGLENTLCDEDDEEELMSLDNNDDIEQFLLQIYRKHDDIDHKYGFLEDDEEETDEDVNNEQVPMADTSNVENNNFNQDELNSSFVEPKISSISSDTQNGEGSSDA